MQKLPFLLLSLTLILGILSVTISSSALPDSINDLASKIDENANKIDNTLNNPQQTADELKENYLKKEWDKIILTKPFIGPIYSGYKKISPYTDPVIEFCVGVKPSISWQFILIFIIWIMLVKYFYTFYEVLRDFSTFSNSTAIIISSAIFVILTLAQFFQNITKWITDKLISLIAILNSWWMQLIAALVSILVIILLAKFSKEIKVLARYIRYQKYKYKKEIEEKERNFRSEIATKKAEAVADALLPK